MKAITERNCIKHSHFIIIILLFISCSSPIGNPTNETSQYIWPSVIAHWTFNGDLLDYGGLSNHLTGNASNFTQSNITGIGQYLHLDYKHNEFCYREESYYLNFSQESHTIEITFKLDSNINYLSFLINKWDTRLGGYQIAIDPTGILYTVLGTYCCIEMIMLDRIREEKWYYLTVAIDRDNNKIIVYVDGEKIISVDTQLTGDISNSSPIYIGQMNGGLNEIFIRRHIYTDEEIHERYLSRITNPLIN